ncbi:hypothetical protein GIB67_008625 [Kingdonia uniflora]|uniref:Uncharacterized protein n=1 Tax=Kingdonia uniflora TaxID=39325 RepID=A0A7J7M558_9MAGN|nr:hypothetical protein GIB67_008625 [Kingdonia uniflora]
MGEKRSSEHWWWASASSAQLIAGITYYRRGVNESQLMPFKAFSVASLFVGAGATTFLAFLRASGIHKVEDLKELGANIRGGLGVPPRKRPANSSNAK